MKKKPKINHNYTAVDKSKSNKSKWFGIIYKNNKEIGTVTVNSITNLIKKYN